MYVYMYLLYNSCIDHVMGTLMHIQVLIVLKKFYNLGNVPGTMETVLRARNTRKVRNI